MSVVAIFDLDDTLIRGQSQKLLAMFLRAENKLALPFMLGLHGWFILYKLGLVSDVTTIMARGWQLTKGVKVSELHSILEQFWYNVLKNRLYPKALEELEQRRHEDRKLVLISNSIQNLLEIIAGELKIHYSIGTQLEVIADKFTGKIKNGVMYGDNKLKAVLKVAEEQSWDLANSYFYTDHHSDLPLLKAVGHPIVVNPTKKLQGLAKDYGWPIKSW